jgi:hypothetical protein
MVAQQQHSPLLPTLSSRWIDVCSQLTLRIDQTATCNSPTIASIIPLPTTRPAAAPVYGTTLDEADGPEIDVAGGAAGMLYVLGGGATYPPVASGAGGAVQDPVP